MISRWARRVVAVPVVLLGLLLSQISEGLIRLGAWLCDVDVSEVL